MSELGERIKDALQERGWTQGQLAKELGIAPANVSFWATGRTVPKEEHLERMEELLGKLTPVKVGDWLRGAREEKGWSRQRLAAAAGVSAATIYNIEEKEDASPRQETIKKLESALEAELPEETNKRLEKESLIEGWGRMSNFNPSDTAREEEWPRVAGVYVLYDKNSRPVYVGQSQNIYERLKDHSEKWWYRKEIVCDASFIEIDDKELRRQVESILIKFLKSFTLFNKQHAEEFDKQLTEE